jgi:hypothetical protein
LGKYGQGKTAQLKRLHILELHIRKMAMSITARLATGTILLLALAGCTEDRMMDRSSGASSGGPAGTAGSSGLGSDQVICPPGSQQPECLRPRTNPDD